MNVTTLEHRSYQLRSGLGVVSATGYSHCDDHPIYGIGQEAGNAPQTWTFLSSVLLQCHEDQVESAKYESPYRTEHLSLPMVVGFVNDNNSQCKQFLRDEQVSIETFATQATHEITTCNSLLRASGGRVGVIQVHISSYGMGLYDSRRANLAGWKIWSRHICGRRRPIRAKATTDSANVSTFGSQNIGPLHHSGRYQQKAT